MFYATAYSGACSSISQLHETYWLWKNGHSASSNMQPMPGNRLGLGFNSMRAPLPSYGQGPSMSTLAQQQQQQQMQHQSFMPPPVQKQTTLFVGSISGGITDGFLNELLSVSYLFYPSLLPTKCICRQACGPIKSFKRLITPANKPQGFGFAEFEEPDAALRCMALLQGVELPALEDGCANKSLLVRLIIFLCTLCLPMLEF